MPLSQTAPAIAFLGTGLMGQPMARRLLAAGFRVIAWNRTQAKAQALAAFGASVAADARHVVARADIVITMLEAGPVVAQVVASVASSLRPGTLLVDMSSTSPAEAKALHAALVSQGVHAIDAPVSGGILGAEAGTLAIMVGGDAVDFERAEPVLRTMGNPKLVGPAGCGQLAKLCNQLIVGGTLAIVAEALLLAEAGGADPAAVRDALRGGFAESRILEVHGQRMLDRFFLPGGQIKSQSKDLENILKTADSEAVKLPVTVEVATIFRQLAQHVPNADQAAVLLALERLNPGIRVGDGNDQLP